jgi:S1-C subfamily serine protease
LGIKIAEAHRMEGGIMKRYIALFVAIIVFMSPVIGIASPSQWAESEIESAIQLGLTTPELLSNYQDDITREEFAEMIINLYETMSGKIALPDSNNTFLDTTNPEILKASKLGIVKGFPGGNFKPAQLITREEIAVMFYRTIKSVYPSTQSSGFKLGFADNNSISTWAAEEVAFMSANGVIKGKGSNIFDPKNYTTREEAIALTLRTYRQFTKNATLPPAIGDNKKKTAEEIGMLSDSVVQLFVQHNDNDYTMGSGFFYEKGRVVTNYHVIENAKSITMEYDDGSVYTGGVTVLGYDKEQDIAVLMVSDSITPALNLGDSDFVQRGQKVYAIGSPAGLTNTLSDGLVSAVRSDMIQITAAVNHGNSGGALLNEYGEVIGIIFARIDNGDNLGFAIPVNSLKELSKDKRLTLKQFNDEVDSRADSPENVLAIISEDETVLLAWDNMRADYFIVYESTDFGTTWEAVVDSKGINKWKWFSDYSIEITGYKPGTKVYYAVAAVTGTIISEYSYSNYVGISTGLTTYEIIDHLYDNMPYIYVNGSSIDFAGYDVIKSPDGTVTSIYAYLTEKNFDKFLSLEERGLGSIAKAVKNNAIYYEEIIGTDIDLVIVYSGMYDENPVYFSENYIFEDVITYDKDSGYWYVWYPLIEVFNFSNQFYSWYGSHSM